MTPHIRRGLGATSALALAALFLLPLGQAANAQISHAGRYQTKIGRTGVRPAPASGTQTITINRIAAQSLTLTSPRNNTHVQIMPTTAWMRAHSNLTSVTAAASRSGGSTSLPSPACTLVTDPSTGDAKAAPPGVGQEGPFNSLDITAAGLATVGANLQAEIKVISLSDSNGEPAMGSGQPDNWFAQWTSGGTTYYLRAQ
ncbi:MAG TPA: hypothetical protein VG815_12305, partial [Chloroflexota bacterium]|nr:hypothetical protein [Chloroflexota bacterium]